MPGRAARLRCPVAALTLATLVCIGMAQEAPAPLPEVGGWDAGLQLLLLREARLESVTQLDQALDDLHRLSWGLHGMVTEPDVRGRTPSQDVDEWLLTEAREARLHALRQQAHDTEARGGVNGGSGALQAAAAIARQEQYMGTVLASYWGLQGLVARHAALLQGLEGDEPAGERAARAARIHEALARLGDQLPRAMAADTDLARSQAGRLLSDYGNNVLRVYNTERGAVAKELSAHERALGRPPAAQTRLGPCPSAAQGTAGGETPKLASGNRAPDSVYPDASRRASLEGEVIVRAKVDAAGCLQEAAVVQSSGVPDLDQAALSWTQQARFLPAEHDHKAVEGSFAFMVRFTLRQ